jgi:hypothetical protein
LTAELRLSRHTIKSHLGRIYRRLGVHSLRDAVGAALQVGVIEAADIVSGPFVGSLPSVSGRVSDVRLVEWMCQVRPGLPAQHADLALQALRTLHMTVHRDGEPCGPATDARAGLCGEGTAGAHGAWLCAERSGHVDEYHHDGRGNRWRTVGQMPGPRHG